MDFSSPELQIKRIVLNRMQRCAVCHRPYESGDIHVLSRRDDMWMMVVECEDCHARNFVAAVLNDGDPNEAQMALERMSEDEHNMFGSELELLADEEDEALPASEAELVPDKGPITAGDVVDMHQFLLTFDGNFEKLFRAES